MSSSFFSEIISPRFNPAAVLDLPQGRKVLVISDFHMGVGRRDDLQPNGEFLMYILEEYYYKNGWCLVLNGDIEELAKFPLKDIQKAWPGMYRVFDLFAAQGRLYKTLGNHDEDLIFERDYPYPLYNAVKIETGLVPIYVYHGHQSSKVYTDFNNIIRLGLKYLLKPIGVRNISSARSPHRRFNVERHAYNFSINNDCISIIGHTHRALFESLGRFDYIKFEIERLCRDYPASSGAEREHIAREVENLRRELGKLKRSERRNVLRESLYGDELPVPCLFNSGSAIGKKGINAIELDNEKIALIYWFTEGKGMKFVSRGYYKVDMLHGGYCRSVLNQDRLDYIKARIELLGSPDIVDNQKKGVL
ncbi:MAG: serine/threonine protein phosphatase [Treponema sp.]|jgi:predicted phosphodiesterase|nr:serine/threonine protein phosphatase [Treponema sp.]